MSLAYSRLERVYVQKETTFGVIPATSNISTMTKDNFIRHTTCNLQGAANNIIRPDKTGMRGILKDSIIAGRRVGRWGITCSLAGASATGAAVPLIDPLLYATFGQSGSVGSNKIAYTMVDDIFPSITVFSYRRPVSLSQRCAFGAVVQQATFTLGGDVAMGSFTGECKGVLETHNYRNCTKANFRTDELGGLLDAETYSITTVATPASPTVFTISEAVTPQKDAYVWISGLTGKWVGCNGIHKMTATGLSSITIAVDSSQFGAFGTQSTVLACRVGMVEEPTTGFPTDLGPTMGFVGSITAGGLTVANMRNLTINVITGNTLVRDTFATYYASGVEGSDRRVTASFVLNEDDTATTMKLMEYASSKTSLDVVAVVGNKAGNYWKFELDNVTLEYPTITDEGVRFALGFGDSQGAMDDLTTPEFRITVSQDQPA